MRSTLLLSSLFACTATIFAQTSSWWDGAQTGIWGDSGWYADSGATTPGDIPNGIDDIANFQNSSFFAGWGSMTLENSIGNDISVTLGEWNQSSTSSGRHIDVRPGTSDTSIMTFDATSGNASINHHANSTSSGLTFQLPVHLNDNLSIHTTGTIATGYREGVTFNNLVSGAASITKTGGATLSFEGSTANTFSGGITINSGLVQGMKSGAFGTGDVHVEETSGTTTAQLEITDGVIDAIHDSSFLYLGSFFDGLTNFSTVTLGTGVNETIAGLYLDNVLQSAGTWGATGSGATHINDDWFSGNGILTVVPEPSASGLIFAAIGITFTFARRRR